MRAIINLSVIFLIFASTLTQNPVAQTSNCDSNCLSCSSTGNCLLCDFSRNMFLINNACTQKTFAGCRLFNVDGSCVACGPNMVVTSTNCEGITATTNGIVQNCVYFGNNPNICLQCAPGYYLLSGLCATSKSNISNCLTYSPDGIYCSSCAYGYHPSQDFTQCSDSQIKSIPGCQKYGFVNCRTCNDGYNLDYNHNYFGFDFQNRILDTVKMTLLQSIHQKANIADYYTRCNSYQISNCQQAASLTICTVCNPGYINALDGSCLPFPQAAIANCLIYSSPTSCTTCASKFWKQSNTSCLPVTPINNCIQYNSNFQSLCTLCENFFYLQNNLCFPRISSLNIPNCQQVFIDRDMCQVCNQGFVLNIYYTQCLPNIFNCNTTIFLQTTLICTSCISGYYLNQGSCVLGTIANCNLYQNSATCLLCMDNFYLASNQAACLPHNLMHQISCQAFSSVIQNYCLTCSLTRVGFNLANICLAVSQLITNCVTYSDSITCSECDSKTSYLSNNACVLGTIVGCIAYHPTKNQCINCYIDSNTNLVYTPSSIPVNNLCLSGNQNPYKNCQTISSDPSKPCIACSQGNFQFLLTSPTIRYCMSILSTAFPPNPKTLNCNVYDYLNNVCLQCVQTGTGAYYAILNGECISSCPTGMTPQAFLISNNQVQQMFVCKNNNFFSPTTFIMQFNIPCLVFDVDLIGSWSCVICSSNTLGIFDLTISANNAMFFSYLLTTSFGVYYSTYNRITVFKGCLSKSNAQINSSTGIMISPTRTSVQQASVDLTFCHSVIALTGTTNYGCIKCNLGYSGIVGAAVGANQYILDTCIQIPFCQSDTWLNGMTWNPSASIPYPMDFYMSCHLCSVFNGNAQIPTFGLSTTNTPTITPNIIQNFIGPFGIPNSLDSITLPIAINPVNRIAQTTCQVPGITQSAAFIKNCGAQTIMIDKPMAPYMNGMVNSSTNPICTVCMPMFLPTYSQTNTIAVQRCTAIPNCAFSTMMNSCEICSTGYALTATSLYQTCTATTITNCFIVDTTGICQLCNKGFILDQDGNCSTVNPLGCSSSNHGFYQPASSLYNMYQFYMQGAGCMKCDTGFIAVYFSNAQPLCVNNPIISTSNNQSFRKTNVYIPYCKYYGLNSNSQIICIECLDNYIISANSLSCFLTNSNTLQYCTLTQNSGTSCFQCFSGYYFNTLSQTCVQGTINNCIRYLNQYTCLVCASGFFLSTPLTGQSICFDGAFMNCAKIDQSQSVEGSLGCLSCANGFYLTSSSIYGNFPLRQCVPIPPITNCVSYSTQNLITASRLNCLSCAAKYYLNKITNLCVSRQITVDNCTSYSPTSDTCLSCALGYYLASSGITCTSNPVGINNCITYLDLKTCSLCSVGMYLWQNSCLTVPEANLINNCLYYKSHFECIKCQNNFFLSQNVCIVAVASNCLTYLDKNKCSSCSSGMGLSLALNIINCITLDVLNCDIPDSMTIGPNFGCLQCSSGYYYSGGKCIIVSTTIPNCKYYINATSCMSCFGNLIVSFDKLSCVNTRFLLALADQNCNANYLQLSCQVCAFGYYISGGNCVACPTNSVSCLQCNPYNLKSCMICNFGYYQVVNGTCIKTTGSSSSNTAIGTNNFTPVIQKHTDFFMLNYFVLGVLFVMYSDFGR